jgi:transcription initiation factor TFIIB
MVRSKTVRASGFTSFLKANYGLQTEIGAVSRDYSGRMINHETIRQIDSLRKLHFRLKSTPRERRMSSVLAMIDRICSKMLLPKSLAETAAKIYRTYSTSSIKKGQSVTGNAVAAVYIACKQATIARSLEEISSSVDCRSAKRSNLKIALKCYREMALGLTDTEYSPDVMNSGSKIGDFEQVLPIDRYITKIVNKAGIDRRIERIAIDIALQTSNDVILSGKDPVGIAAAYLYMACCLVGYHMHLADMADHSKVTEVTIRSRCREILSSYGLEIIVRGTSANASAYTASMC